jgi:hypothetical protein
MRKLALAIVLVSSVTGGLVGCGSSSPRKATTGTAGSGGSGTAGSTGTSGTGGATGGTGGMAGATAGTTGGTGGMAGGTAGTPAPIISSSTTVLEIDDVVVSLTNPVSAPDGGTDAADDAGDSGTADGGTSDAGTGDGGTSDAGPAGPPATGVSYTFDTTIEGWKYTSYGSTPIGPPSATNYASTSTLVWSTDDADGKSTSGSLKGTVPFQYDNDQIDFQAFSVQAGMFDWSAGYTVSAKVRQVSGGNLRQNCPLSAWLYLSEATDYNTGNSPHVDLVPGQWVTVSFATSAFNPMVNLTGVSQLGIEINTEMASACTGPLITDGGTDGPADAGADAPATDAPATDATDAPVDAGTTDVPTDTTAG